MTDKQTTRRHTDELTDTGAAAVRTAVRHEIRAARDELRDELWRPPLKRSARLYAAAGAVGLCAAGAATALLVLLFDLAMPAWAAALVVTALLAALAATLRTMARIRPEEPGMLPHTGGAGEPDAASGPVPGTPGTPVADAGVPPPRHDPGSR